ncbi:GNAT family N-acetyltransferase [Halobacillus litoralis]|uniref:GNAT family N-acetyltransferase n=1 Tax=Halobacillus litoralis TaxID=45668 RepID=UPI00136A3782|nr:GNAT family N-acetyltransferase [Halobacillus litoralis]
MYPLFNTVFGIPENTFKDFYFRGFWDPTYKPYSFFSEGYAVANVSTFDFPIFLNGVLHKAAGIQSVMTHPDYRKKGLMNTLMKKALAEIDESYNLSFLVTSDPNLYKKYGFRILNEYFYVKDYNHKGSHCADLKSIDVFDSHDLKKIQDLFKKNVPSTSVFYPVNYEHPFYLNMYNPNMKNLVYYSASLDLMIMYEVVDNKLELFDVIGSSLPDLDKICSLIPEPFHEIHLFFNPDKFSTGFNVLEYDSPDKLMVRGNLEISQPSFKLPIFAEF